MSGGSSLPVKPSDLTMSNHPEEDHRGKPHELSMCTHVHTLLHNSRVRSKPRPSIPLASWQWYQLLIQLLSQKWYLSGIGQLTRTLLISTHNCIIHWLALVSSALKPEWELLLHTLVTFLHPESLQGWSFPSRSPACGTMRGKALWGGKGEDRPSQWLHCPQGLWSLHRMSEDPLWRCSE